MHEMHAEMKVTTASIEVFVMFDVPCLFVFRMEMSRVLMDENAAVHDAQEDVNSSNVIDGRCYRSCTVVLRKTVMRMMRKTADSRL